MSKVLVDKQPLLLSKKAVDDKTKEMTEAADKTLETSLQALGYSFGFYNDVLTDE